MNSKDRELLIRIDERTESMHKDIQGLLVSDTKQWSEIRQMKYTRERLIGLWKGLGMIAAAITTLGGVGYTIIQAVSYIKLH